MRSWPSSSHARESRPAEFARSAARMGMRTSGLTSDFWRSVASVLTGTALAQAIPILGSLVIARQYAPSEFGRFSAWLGLVLLAAVALTGRFETALALEPDGEPRRRAMVIKNKKRIKKTKIIE